MFLKTLGFTPDNNQLLKTCISFGGSWSNNYGADRRGSQELENKIKEEILSQICKHIESYSPRLPDVRMHPTGVAFPRDANSERLMRQLPNFNETRDIAVKI